MFATNLEQFGPSTALIPPDGKPISYRDLALQADEFAGELGEHPGLLILEAYNDVRAIVAYVSALRHRHPVLLLPPRHRSNADVCIAEYLPTSVYRRDQGNWRLERLPNRVAVHADLAVLLSTSGTTGSCKYVRLSQVNLQSNADSIREYMGLVASDVAITGLPVSHAYGLSVVNSHLTCGAALVVTERSVIEPEFWTLVKSHGVTGLSGVPHTYDLFERMGLERMDLPSLRYLTQAGGRLHPDKVVRLGRLARARGWRFFVMYGQTEATARMAYVPPEELLAHPDTIGVPIPGGAIELRDEEGVQVRAAETPGEIIYRGRNVMMGYAQGASDLAVGAGLAELATGDLACRDQHGFLRIIGRKSRIAKPYGLRIQLDELEKELRSDGFDSVCAGNDERLVLAVTNPAAAFDLAGAAGERTGLPPQAISVLVLEAIPLLPSGKHDLARLLELATERRPPTAQPATPVLRDAYREILALTSVDDGDSFTSLGGDSLAYVEASVAIEQRLGYLPAGWENLSLAELCALPRRSADCHSVETAALLRAVAIIGVVMGHALLFGRGTVMGGAELLLLLCGFSFARFQARAVFDTDRASCALRGLAKIVAMTVAVLVLQHAIHQRFHPSALLQFSNFTQPDLDPGDAFWFIEVLAQLILLMFLVLLLPAVRSRFRARPYAGSLVLLALGIAPHLFGPWYWSNANLPDRVPHLMLWTFALGLCIQFGRDEGKRRINTVLVLTLPFVTQIPWTNRFYWMVLLPPFLIWLPSLALPRRVVRVVACVASASFYIYLTNLPWMRLLKVTGCESSFAKALVGLAGGVLIWVIADRLWARLRTTTCVRPPWAA